MTDDAGDPILIRRARFAAVAKQGKRVGYGLLVVAIAAFAIGTFAGYSTVVTTVVTVSMLATTVTLAPAMVIGYAVAKAEREEQGIPRRRPRAPRAPRAPRR